MILKFINHFFGNEIAIPWWKHAFKVPIKPTSRYYCLIFFWVFVLALFQQNPSKSQIIITVLTLFSIDSRLVEIWFEVCACVCFRIIFGAIKTLYHWWTEWVNDEWMGGWLEDWLQFVWSWVLCYNVKKA